MKKSLRPTAKTLWQLFLSTLYITRSPLAAVLSSSPL